MEFSALTAICLFLWSGAALADDAASVSSLGGQDLHLRSPQMTVYSAPPAPWDHLIGFSGGATITVGDNRISGKEGILWLKVQGGPSQRYYQAYVYVEGSVSVEQGPRSRTTASRQLIIDETNAIAMQFLVTGEVFAVAPLRNNAPAAALDNDPLYLRGYQATGPLAFGPGSPTKALPPVYPHPGLTPRRPAVPGQEAEPLPRTEGPTMPVHISSVWEPAAEIRKTTLPDGQEVIIASGRFYLWQQQRDGRMVEFMADSVVLYLETGEFELTDTDRRGSELGRGRIRTAYLSGDIVLTEADRTVRADEIFYDFRNQRALIVNAAMRTYDERRGLPIYLRAEKLGRVSEQIFEGENIQLTSSEFYLPQISLNAAKMILVTDEQTIRRRDTAATVDARLYDVDARYENITFFRWPQVRTNFIRPDMPLSSVRFGNDSEFGTAIETRWHLARLLGIKEPPGLESRLGVDYYSKRGFGAGVDAEYQTDYSIGSLTSYVMRDRGRDHLGSIPARRRVDPGKDYRGRFSFRHREFLNDGWQVTLETSYLSDRNFHEWMYRDEFYTDKEQETLLYVKRIWDNQAFSILGKMRINDFETTTEELPTVEYHRIGQSFWDHQLTWYSSTQVSRMRERFDRDDTPGDGSYYTYAFTRNEVSLPLNIGSFKLVPFAAGSYGFEDGQGWQTNLQGNTVAREDSVFLGETGVRGSTMLWKEDPHFRSAFWNVNGLRHIITPYFETAVYQPSDAAIDMRDYVHVGATQRWQTHRPAGGAMESVDWMRLDVNGTWVRDGANASVGPAQAYDPVLNRFGGRPAYGPAWFIRHNPAIPPLLRRDMAQYGLMRDSLNADYEWRVSETFTLLADGNYDTQSGHLQQFNVGMNRYVWPDISYYLGSRYLRPLSLDLDTTGDGNDDVRQRGSHSVIGAITWQLSPRYTMTFAQEYNFDFGHNVRSEVTIVRQYHRMYYALSFSIDETLKRNAVMFSIWPQGVDELTVGARRHTHLAGAMREE